MNVIIIRAAFFACMCGLTFGVLGLYDHHRRRAEARQAELPRRDPPRTDVPALYPDDCGLSDFERDVFEAMRLLYAAEAPEPEGRLP